MIVPTMCIRVMRVFMRQSFVAMQVAVLDVGRHRPIMRVLVMRIVEMYMLMLAHLMRVRVAMPLGQVQPDAERHEAASGQQTQPDRFIEQRNRQCGTEDRRDRKFAPVLAMPRLRGPRRTRPD